MSGEHIRKAQQITTHADATELKLRGFYWLKYAAQLNGLASQLSTTAEDVQTGFQGELEGDPDGTAKRGSKAFRDLAKQVAERAEQMEQAGTVLRTAGEKLAEVVKFRASAYGDIGTAPTEPSSVGKTDDEYDADKKQYDQDKAAYDAKVTAQGQQDEDARIALAELDQAYADASEVLAKIHGEPVYPEDVPPADENVPGGPGLPRGPRSPLGSNPGDDHLTTEHHWTPVDPTRPPQVEHPWDPLDPWDPGHPGDFLEPGAPPVGPSVLTPAGGPGGGGGGGVNPFAAGAVGAGVAGVPGLANAVRGLLGGGGGVPGQSVGRIGASSRAGGPGSLGRSSGVGTPGNQAGRGTGGRAGGRGAAGAAGGRGTRGGAGAAGAAGGRGRRKDDENPAGERDLFDDGSDWIDDEGTAPGVLS